jgi:hypothetical protein
MARLTLAIFVEVKESIRWIPKLCMQEYVFYDEGNIGSGIG